jgi:hypothetical protein
MNTLTVAKLRITEATLNDEKFVTGKTIELAKKIFSRLRYACLRSVGTKSAGFPLFHGNLVFTIYG